MAAGSMETALMSDPTAKLPDDLLVEIISRVPYKSTRCCKCVSTRWRDLVSHPDHRDKLPRSTLAGFFYKTYDMDSRPPESHAYRSVSGSWCPIDASLSFLPKYKNLELLDCCNGLLLCRCSKPYPETPDFIVCNPATEKWVIIPANEWSERSYARLGFDPAVSSHFHVFELVPSVAFNANLKYDYNIEEVGIYSSKAGGWTHQIEWDDPTEICNFSGGTFLSGVLYLCCYNNLVAAIDLEGNCHFIPAPTVHDARCGPYVYVSRGQLYVANYGTVEASIWVLENSGGEDYWTMKHNVSYVHLFGSSSKEYYGVISAHPDDYVIFITVQFTSGYRRTQLKLFSYEIDSNELRFICDLGRTSRCPYLSYVPLFSESLADGH